MPPAPRSIEKGASLKDLLGKEAIRCLAHNLSLGHPRLDQKAFERDSLQGLEPLSIMERGPHLAHVMRRHLPQKYEAAIKVILRSLGPPLEKTDSFGLGVFFYLPHVCFVAHYGVDDFDISMRAQFELTRRFSAEFSLRAFLIRWPERTLKCLMTWTTDKDPHVRRLCSEGSRPRLPWAPRIPSFITDPRPVLPILEALKDDADLYVRRSVANHLGDIAKDHPALAFEICERWLAGASAERKWLIRHALRHPAKKGDKTALNLRSRAK